MANSLLPDEYRLKSEKDYVVHVDCTLAHTDPSLFINRRFGQSAHVPYPFAKLKEFEKAGERVFTCLVPLEPAGCWIRVIHNVNARKSKFIYVKHGSMIILPITTIHCNNLTHSHTGCRHARIYLHLIPKDKVDKKISITQQDDTPGYVVKQQGNNLEGYQLPQKMDNKLCNDNCDIFSADAHITNVWYTKDMKYFNKFFQL